MDNIIKQDKYAFIVGGGDLPKKIITTAKLKALDFVVVGIRGVSDKGLVNQYNNFWFYLGQIAFLLDNLKAQNITKIVLVGALKRPSLWEIRVDSLGRELIKNYLSKAAGDNDLLSNIIMLFEERGFTIESPQSIDDSILASEKIYTIVKPSESLLKLCYDGFDMAKKLSIFDVGQSIIMQQNMVVSVEAIEGTANMILRSKKLLKRYGDKGILIKVKKKDQEIRVDLPTIGDKTIKQLHKAGLAGIVIEAGSTIILNQESTVALANKYGLFIMAIKGNKLS